MDQERTDWEKAVEFHGHSCPGLASGYRAAKAALRALGVGGRAADEELIAIAETDSCGVDAVQVVTGCTAGKGNLFFRDYGKHAYTIGRRSDGRAVRVVVKDLGRHQGGLSVGQGAGPKPDELRSKVMAGQARPEEEEQYRKLQAERVQRILEMPEEEICQIQEVKLDFPDKARIFSSVTCARCGEKVMEPRARVRDGQIVCIPCSELYERRW
ncbi:MAG: TraR/DksA C4-type zinc finger protein [Clostridia bacterium]|nr:TraR/DksA C4-type zinc finger protein [Clostridia bacterium]